MKAYVKAADLRKAEAMAGKLKQVVTYFPQLTHSIGKGIMDNGLKAQVNRRLQRAKRLALEFVEAIETLEKALQEDEDGEKE